MERKRRRNRSNQMFEAHTPPVQQTVGASYIRCVGLSPSSQAGVIPPGYSATGEQLDEDIENTGQTEFWRSTAMILQVWEAVLAA